MNKDRTWLLAHPNHQIPQNMMTAMEQKVVDLCSGVPLPYLIGKWEFFGLEFILTKDVLIPRPETELLVEYALKEASWRKGTIFSLDVGTGSGCIPVALCVNSDKFHFFASDISRDALNITRLNIKKHGLQDRITLVQSDLIPPGKYRYDLITANLPYISSTDLATLNVSKYEPLIALDGGRDGTEQIEEFLSQARVYIKNDGTILFEIEESHGNACVTIATRFFPDHKIDLLYDLAGRARLICIKKH